MLHTGIYIVNFLFRDFHLLGDLIHTLSENILGFFFSAFLCDYVHQFFCHVFDDDLLWGVLMYQYRVYQLVKFRGVLLDL